MKPSQKSQPGWGELTAGPRANFLIAIEEAIIN
jgi:hypothetical protein